jgi:PadR family transcriptional regulator, regulatory protein PadR
MLRELFLGFIRIHILHHAAEESVFGLALMAELARHDYHVGPGTLYPILHSMEQQGYLRAAGQVVNGKVRKYYRITPAGRRILARAQAQLHELVDEVLPRTTPKGRAVPRGNAAKTQPRRRRPDPR